MFDDDGRFWALAAVGGIAMAGAVTGSRGVVRKGRSAAEEPDDFASRLANLEHIDRICVLDEDGVPLAVPQGGQNFDRFVAWLFEAPGRRKDGGIVFAKSPRGVFVRNLSREGYVLLRAASVPQEGFLLYTLERDPNDDSGQDQSLWGAAQGLFHQLTKRDVDGGTELPLDHPLVRRIFGITS